MGLEEAVEYAFSEPSVVAMDLAQAPGQGRAYTVDLLLRARRRAIPRDKFSDEPIAVYLNAEVLSGIRVTSRPSERRGPRVPVRDGTRILIKPFALSAGQEVRITVTTAGRPHDLDLEVDAPDVRFRRVRWR